MTRVALIDDHESVRLGLEAACARVGSKDVVFSGSTVTEYLKWRAASAAAPADVVVLDLTLGDGTTVTENVRRLVLDGSSVIIHSVADRPAAVREALAAGAAGVVSKSSRIDDVIAAVSTVAKGEPLNNVEWASAVEGDREFADAVRRPVSNSLLFEAYRRMPNNTDFTVYKWKEVSGLNFAFTRGAALYHSERDDLAHLDKASLQHQGDNVLAALMRIANTPVEELVADGDATYFDVGGMTLPRWPSAWGPRRAWRRASTPGSGRSRRWSRRSAGRSVAEHSCCL